MAGPLNAVLGHVRRLAPPASDAELLERFVAGRDEAAFAALVERHGGMVLGLCRRVLRNAHDAEDAAQATFLVLARKAAAVRAGRSVAAFLHGVAYHVASTLRRDLRRRDAREAAAPPAVTDGADAGWREALAILDEELGRLPEHQRAPLILCYLEGKTRDEAAAQLGWSLATLRGRLERGRERLRARLRRRGLAPSVALLAAATSEGGAVSVAAASARAAALAEAAVAALFAGRTKAAVMFLGVALAVSVGLGLAVAPGERRGVSPPVQRPEPAGLRRAARPLEADVPPRFLDLRPLANMKLDEGFGREANNLAGLPRGEQTLAGVRFSIGEGLILLKGSGLPRPERAEGIAVGAKCSRLHILHATHYDAAAGTRVGSYVVHYEGGGSETIPVVFGEDVGNWWFSGCSQRPTRAAVAWKGRNDDAMTVSGAVLHLYLLSWNNPAPVRPIARIDFTSASTVAAPFCVAMTAEE